MSIDMRIMLALVILRSVRALSTIPAAARRLQKIKELETQHASLVASGAKPAAVRNARKELGRLKRTPPPADEVQSRVATFYGFFPVREPSAVVARLRQALEEDGLVLGSVSVANEGYNGALAVPVERRAKLAQTLSQAAPELWPSVADAEAALNWDAAPTQSSPFHRLLVKEKKRALVDGFEEPLDWADCGAEVAPEAWHGEIAAPGATVLDVRNAYESDAGSFAGAVPLNTSTFVESFDQLDIALAGRPRDAPVHMFCTGGVRCVKAGAYVKQKLGFTDVRRLEQGVVAYERWQAESGAESRFEGENFVFDKRVGPQVVSDADLEPPPPQGLT